jgi:hypothetical protein
MKYIGKTGNVRILLSTVVVCRDNNTFSPKYVISFKMSVLLIIYERELFWFVEI